jgi:hypothetical protein
MPDPTRTGAIAVSVQYEEELTVLKEPGIKPLSLRI